MRHNSCENMSRIVIWFTFFYRVAAAGLVVWLPDLSKVTRIRYKSVVRAITVGQMQEFK
jgi:hypothetical protein